MTHTRLQREIHTSSTVQGGGGRFKDRIPERLVVVNHGWQSPLMDGKVVGASGYLFVYLSSYLSIYLSNQPINLPIYQPIYQSIYQSISLSIYQSINLSVYQSINESINQPIKLSIGLSVYHLSVCLSICRLENEAILRDFLNFRSCYASKQSNSARLASKIES